MDPSWVMVHIISISTRTSLGAENRWIEMVQFLLAEAVDGVGILTSGLRSIGGGRWLKQIS